MPDPDATGPEPGISWREEALTQVAAVNALDAENVRLHRVIAWCRPRLGRAGYRETLDDLMAGREGSEQ